MPIIGWIRDLFGIQKDMYETKKTRLEIEKIEDEKREKLITLATLDDVKKYDPKHQKLIETLENLRGGIGWPARGLIILLKIDIFIRKFRYVFITILVITLALIAYSLINKFK
jgi:hypothetical protein